MLLFVDEADAFLRRRSTEVKRLFHQEAHPNNTRKQCSSLNKRRNRMNCFRYAIRKVAVLSDSQYDGAHPPRLRNRFYFGVNRTVFPSLYYKCRLSPLLLSSLFPFPQRRYNRNPFLGTHLLEVSIGRDLGTLKGLHAVLLVMG